MVLLNPVNPSIATISMSSRRVSGVGGQSGFEDLLGVTRDHVQESGGVAAFSDGRQVQDDGDVFVAVGGVAPHVFIHPDGTHAIEPSWINDQ